MKPSRLRPIVLTCVVLAIAAAGWFGRETLFGARDATAGMIIATAERRNLEDVVTATGTLQPRDYVDVGAQVSGMLNRIHVEVGDEVREGQLLAEIDPRVLASRVDATNAQLRNQRAQLLEREANLDLAKLQYRRQQNLMAEEATSREALQNAEATLRAAHAQIEALRAQIDQTESNLRADEANLEYTRILAPMNGTVVSIEARQGQTLNANQQAPNIMRIADLSTMTVETEVSEADISRLQVGMDVWFTTLGGNSQRWEGKLRRIDPTPTITNNVVLYNALFDVPNEDGWLMTQMTAQVFFVISRAENALLVPMAAIAGGPRARGARGGGAQRATVRVVDENNRIVERPVEVGISNRIEAQILSGLSEGERVVAGGATTARGGAAGR
jgi:macrolide-specific efflux system membrane fusion protein